MGRGRTDEWRRRSPLAAGAAVLAMLAGVLVAATPVAGASTTSTSPASATATASAHVAACPPEQVPGAGFDDLAGGVHDEAIACLAWWGLAQGRTATTFDPQAPLSRGAAGRLIARLLAEADVDLSDDGPAFSDLGERELAEQVRGLAALDVVAGFDDGTFRASRPATRGQLASLLARTGGGVLDLDLPAGNAAFDDIAGSPHASAVTSLTALDVLRGRSATVYAPQSATTRAQAASALTRLLGVLVEQGRLAPPGEGEPDPSLDEHVRLNELQTIGSHNSYRLLPPELVMTLLEAVAPELAEELDYEHPPLTRQLEAQGVRQLELDVFADPDGGRYAHPLVLALTDDLPEGGLPELREPGYKVMHVQDVDFATTCPTLVGCLEEVRDWSQANPDHVPLAILIETKVDPVPVDLDDIPIEVPGEFVEPLAITPELLDDLDAEIRSVFADDELIVPDDVRGELATLEAAVLAGDWPTLADSRGKVLFLMDQPRDRAMYRDWRPSLEGRVMFTPSEPGEEDAAFLKINQPLGAEERIRQAVANGYVVRTRADSPTRQARENDTTQRDAALHSGAQWVSTDYPVPSELFESDYRVTFDHDGPARCNPVNAPDVCVDTDLG